MDLLSELQHAEFKEAFDEFDKVSLDVTDDNTMLFMFQELRILKQNARAKFESRAEERKEIIAALTVRRVAE